MPGLDLSVKLRDRLGAGGVVPAEVLAEKLRPLDRDEDGALSRDELTEFFTAHRIGGPWFAGVVVGQLWRSAEQRAGGSVETVSIGDLAGVLHFMMTRPARAESRYVLTPGAVRGTEPRVSAAKVAEAPRLLSGAPRDAPRATGAAPRPRSRRPMPRARRPMPRNRPR